MASALALTLAVGACGGGDHGATSSTDRPAEAPLGLAYVPDEVPDGGLPDGPTRPGEAIGALAVVPGGRLAAAQGGDVVVWAVDDPGAPPLQLRGGHGPVDALGVTADGLVAARDGDGRVVMWDPDHPDTPRPAPADGTDLPVAPRLEGLWASDVRTLDNGLLVVARTDATVEIRHPGGDDEPPLVVFTGHRSGVLQLAVLSDGRVASGDAGGTVHVWAPSRPDESVTFTGHREAVTALVETGDGRVASASLDGTVQVWDPSDLGPGPPVVTELGDTPTALAVLADGRLAVGTAAGTVSILAAPGPAPSARAR